MFNRAEKKGVGYILCRERIHAFLDFDFALAFSERMNAFPDFDFALAFSERMNAFPTTTNKRNS